MLRIWLYIKAWYRGSKCVCCGALDATNGVCQRKECQKVAEEYQAFSF